MLDVLGWFKKKAVSFEDALVKQMHTEFALLEPEIYDAVRTMVGKAVSDAEATMKGASGDAKYSSVLAAVTHSLEVNGVAGVKLLFSSTVKDALIHMSVLGLKAGVMTLVS